MATLADRFADCKDIRDVLYAVSEELDPAAGPVDDWTVTHVRAASWLAQQAANVLRAVEDDALVDLLDHLAVMLDQLVIAHLQGCRVELARLPAEAPERVACTEVMQLVIHAMRALESACEVRRKLHPLRPPEVPAAA